VQMLYLKSAKEHKRTSRFVGVAWDRRRGAWWAKINVEGRRLDLGLHADEVEAAKAYNKVAAKLGRPTNFLPEGE
jgi:hypothetical protein